MSIYTVRTTRGREKTVIKALRARMDNKDLNIKAIFYPQDLRGYIFIEGQESDIEELTKDLRYVRGIISKEVPLSDLEKFLSEEPEEIELEEGDVVDVMGGPFKGEEAKVSRIDKANREVTIELIEAAVPIPVTISANMLRKKSNKDH